jgi:hypothetical protein
MATRRTILLTFGLAGALLVAAGCVDTDRPPSRSQRSEAAPSPTLDKAREDKAREDLLQALRRTQGASHRYTVRGTLPERHTVQASGGFDPKARRFEAKVKIADGKDVSDTHRIVLDQHSYLREAGDDFWVHLDLGRVKEDSLVYLDMSDPTGLTEFASVLGSVRQTGPNEYTGRFNPDSGLDPFLPLGAPRVVSFGIAAGDFTATTDGKGWVTSITVELEPTDGPKITMTTTLSGHGTKLSIKAPGKAQVREAAEEYYEK